MEASDTDDVSSAVNISKATYDALDVDALLAPLGGIKKYVSRNERVLLKINLLSPSDPTQAIVTHPAVVKAVAESVLAANGIPYIGDSPSGQFTKNRLKKAYERSGLTQVAEELGIELNYNTRSKKVQIPDAKRMKEAPVSMFYLDADKVIALPKLKTHTLMIMTLATKIMYGVIPGLTKATLHSRHIKRPAFADMLLDLLSIAPANLYIMDGIIGMQGDGPLNGIPYPLNVVMASENPVALDIAVMKTLGIESVGVPTLKQAKIRGLWPDKIIYPLLSPKDVHGEAFRLPSTAGYILTGKRTPRKSPVVMNNCKACKLCIEICPRDAIQMDAANSIAIIDYQRCIRCYCCHEVCPHNAISLKSLRGR